MAELEIPLNIFEQIVEQARAESPLEACGILAGKGGKVERLYKMTNADKSSDHFMLAPPEQFAVVKQIRQANLEMLAIYHSHPASPARPSAEDIRLALTPDVIYVIVSLQNPAQPDIKGFLIKDATVTEVGVKLVENQTLTNKFEIDGRLDLRNVLCPLNFVKAKLKLEQMQAGQILEITIDDGEPIANLPRAVKEEGHRILSAVKTPDNAYKLLIKKDGGLKNG